jgi:hypothetical protein
MLRMDRALRVAKEDGSGSSKATKDPRFDERRCEDRACRPVRRQSIYDPLL